MANKRLSTEQMNEMRDMVVRGVSPEDISNHFSIAISSVHNYKKRFREEGLVFPNVRGSRPVGSVTKTVFTTKSSDMLKENLDQVEQMAKQLANLQASMKMQENKTDVDVMHSFSNDNNHLYKVIINDNLIEIKGRIRNILLKNNVIEVVV